MITVVALVTTLVLGMLAWLGFIDWPLWIVTAPLWVVGILAILCVAGGAWVVSKEPTRQSGAEW